jgi:Ran GTPase-activating protein (RanGAP) involved in mRNA processing and transport
VGFFGSTFDVRYAGSTLAWSALDPRCFRVHLTVSVDADDGSWDKLLAVLRANEIVVDVHVLDGNEEEEKVVDLLHALQGSTNLVSLFLASNDLGDESMSSVAHLLLHNQGMQLLDLSNNMFSEQGLLSLSSALGGHSSLRRLDLSMNNLGLRDLSHFSSALKSNTALEILSLSINRMTSANILQLVPALQKNKALKYLYLGRNNIGREGMVHLASALEKNSALSTLHLAYNEIGDGIHALAHLLTKNARIESLTIKDNDIPSSGIDELFKAVERHPSLRRLRLRIAMAPMDETVYHRLATMLRHNNRRIWSWKLSHCPMTMHHCMKH